MSRSAPQTWFAVPCQADASPPLARLRDAAGEYADVLYFRTLAFCKLYAPQGQMLNAWDDLRRFVRWPGETAELRDLFLACGIASGPSHEIYLWDASNGWLIRKYAADAKRHADKRKAGRASGRARKRARTVEQNPGLGCRSVGRGVRSSADVPRTVRGRDLRSETPKLRKGNHGKQERQ